MRINPTRYDDAITVLTIQSMLEEYGSIDASKRTHDQEEFLQMFEPLSYLSYAEWFQIGLHAISIDINIDTEKLRKMTNKIDQEKQARKNYLWAIEHGATNIMLSQMFPSMFSEQAAAKHRQGRAPFKRRIKITDETILHRIYALWNDERALDGSLNTSTPKPLLRLKFVFDTLNGEYDLGMIYGALVEFYEQPYDVLKVI